jgi:pantothenate synthetase
MERVDFLNKRVLLAAAVFAGKTRLIDNVLIEPEV